MTHSPSAHDLLTVHAALDDTVGATPTTSAHALITLVSQLDTYAYRPPLLIDTWEYPKHPDIAHLPANTPHALAVALLNVLIDCAFDRDIDPVRDCHFSVCYSIHLDRFVLNLEIGREHITPSVYTLFLFPKNLSYLDPCDLIMETVLWGLVGRFGTEDKTPMGIMGGTLLDHHLLLPLPDMAPTKLHLRKESSGCIFQAKYLSSP